MTHLRLSRAVLVVSLLGSGIVLACSSDDDAAIPPATVPDAGPRGVEPAGQACTAASQCYPNLADAGGGDAGVQGTVTCLDRVTNGYCTHTCTSDSDCCATPGECRTGVKQVCAPFTNDSSTKYCFLSCDAADIQTAIAANASAGYYDGGTVDSGSVDTAYCQSYASVYATCRSSGGGNQNRKVCVPQQ